MNPAFATITIFALVCTKLVDTIRNAVDPGMKAAPWVWNVAAFAVGLGLSVVWELNALEAISSTPAQGFVGQILTGFGIGAAGGGWHELLDALSSHNGPRRKTRS